MQSSTVLILYVRYLWELLIITRSIQLSILSAAYVISSPLWWDTLNELSGCVLIKQNWSSTTQPKMNHDREGKTDNNKKKKLQEINRWKRVFLIFLQSQFCLYLLSFFICSRISSSLILFLSWKVILCSHKKLPSTSLSSKWWILHSWLACYWTYPRPHWVVWIPFFTPFGVHVFLFWLPWVFGFAKGLWLFSELYIRGRCQVSEMSSTVMLVHSHLLAVL